MGPEMQQQERKRALVFISYSHDSPEHLEQVFELCEKLRKLGFDCRVDQHEVFPAVGWRQWAASQFANAVCVLVVCTRNYLELYRQGCHEHLWQGPVLDPEVFNRSETRFVPVLFDHADAPFVPEPLQSFSHFHVADERGLELLAVYLGEKLGHSPGPVEPRAPLPRRQVFAAPLPVNKPWRLPGPATALFSGRDRERRQLEGQCRKSGAGRIMAREPGLGRSQLVLQHAARHGDDYVALLWLDWGDEAFLRHELAVCAAILGLRDTENTAESLANRLRDWLRSHDHWLVVLRGWSPEEPLSQALVPRKPQGCLLFLPPVGETDEDDAAAMLVEPLPEKDFLALLRNRTARRALMRPEREAVLNLNAAMNHSTTMLDVLGALAHRTEQSFQDIHERLRHRKDISMGLLELCVEQAPPELRGLLCACSIQGVARVPEDALLRALDLQGKRGVVLLQEAASLALAGHFSREGAWSLNSGLEPLARGLLPPAERKALLEALRAGLDDSLRRNPEATLHAAVLGAVEEELRAEAERELQVQAVPRETQDADPATEGGEQPAPGSAEAPTSDGPNLEGQAPEVPEGGAEISDLAPEELVFEDVSSEEPVPEGDAPKDIAPENVISEDVAPEDVVPEDVTSEDVVEPVAEEPDAPLPDVSEPEPSLPEAGVPESPAPETSLPDPPLPEPPLPDAFAPDTFAPDATAPEPAARPEPEPEPMPEQDVPEPEQVEPRAVSPETMTGESASPEPDAPPEAPRPDDGFAQEVPWEYASVSDAQEAFSDDFADDSRAGVSRGVADDPEKDSWEDDTGPGAYDSSSAAQEAPPTSVEDEEDMEGAAVPGPSEDLEPMRQALGRAWARRVTLPAVPEPGGGGILGRLFFMIGRFFYRGHREASPSDDVVVVRRKPAPTVGKPKKKVVLLEEEPPVFADEPLFEPPISSAPVPEEETTGPMVERTRAPSVRPADSEPDLPATATECEKRAAVYREEGRLREAEPFLARALQLQEKLHGQDHLESARAANALGELYRQLGELEQAEPLLERALDIRVSIWGDEHPEVAQSCTNLGSLRLAQGRMAEAEALYVRSLRMDESLFGLEHPNTATDCNNLAVLYFRMERFAEALRNIKRAMAIREVTLGEGHPLHAQACENCAAILRKLGRSREAEEIMSRARGAWRHFDAASEEQRGSEEGSVYLEDEEASH